MNLVKLALFALSFGVATAHAVDVSGIAVNGEISFDYNFLSSGNQTAVPNVGGATNEAYRLNTAQILLKKETEQISFLSRLAYTQTNYDVTDSAGTSTSKANIGTLDQVEIFYKALPSLQVGFGRFLTTLGYESLLKGENATYGNTIAYQTLVPGYGEGLRAKYTLNEYFSATASTYNRMKFSQWGEDYSPTKATELSATGTVAGLTWFAGYLFGKDGDDTTPLTGTTERASGDAWVSYKFMDNLSLAITYDSLTTNVNDAGTNWSDSASAIVTYGWGMNNFALRYEMVRGAMHIGYGASDTVNSITISDKIVMNENLNLYVEYRADQADEDSFVDTDGAATKNASIITLGALAKF